VDDRIDAVHGNFETARIGQVASLDLVGQTRLGLTPYQGPNRHPISAQAPHDGAPQKAGRTGYQYLQSFSPAHLSGI
jgi:hypothetical protein